MDADLEGKTDLKIRALEVVEELRTKRADKQVSDHPLILRSLCGCPCSNHCFGAALPLLQFMLLVYQDSYMITILEEHTNNSFGFLSISKQSMLLLDAFNKDRASLPQPLPNPPPLAPLPVVAPDPRTQEMINEKLKKAEDLGKSVIL